MKQMEVQKIPYGETFRAFRDTFVALDRVDGGVLAIRRDIWKVAQFDSDGKNDFRRASIRNDLVDYLIDFCRNAANLESLVMADIDLKATDSTREYGYDYGIGAALLTLEQYGKYKHIIPDVDNEWWLATPHTTPGQKNGNTIFAWCVGRYGINLGNCQRNIGIRPALVFAPSLLVKHEDSGKESDGREEEALYEKYIEYMYDWLNNWGEVCGIVGESPLSYDAWKEQEKSDE